MVKPYRVKAGQVLGQNGKDVPAGTVVELDPRVAAEIKHLVAPIDPATGDELPWQPADVTTLEVELATARPHERVSILEGALKEKRGDVAKLEAMLTQAKKEEKAAAAKPASAPIAKDDKG